jgi:hypothetical protein
MEKAQHVFMLREAWTFLHQVEIKGSAVYPMFQAMARLEAVILDMEKPEEKPKEEANDL